MATEGLAPRRIALFVAMAIGALLLLWLVLAATVTITTGEIAVMTRFGRVTGQELGEGFHIKNPLDRANKYDIKVQKTDAKADAASRDLQDVHATLVLNYTLEAGKISEIHQEVGVLYREKLIDPAIQEVFKASTARYNARELIQERAAVKAASVDLLRARLEAFGVRVVDLSLTDFAFSPEFTASIEAKQVAEQNAEKARFNLEAAKLEAEAQEVQAKTLSPLFLQKLFLDKWNGQLPNVLGDKFSFLTDLTGQVRGVPE
jgi:regulator of protease activity HflC (stomatin/prohibitin superfamily)